MNALPNILPIYKRELRSYFNSPVAYVVIVVFLAVLGWFFTNNLFLMNVASLRIVFDLVPLIFLFFIPIALSESLLRPHWAGMQNLFDDWANFCSYLTYFIFGYLFCSDPRFGQALDRSWKWALIPALSLFFGFFWLISTNHVPPRAYSPGFMLLQVVAALHSWSWLVVFLGLGRKYLNFTNPILTYANQAAYPFYILHQTVIVVIGFYVVQWNAGIPLKYLVITTASLIGSILIYDLLVKRTNITRALFGMKPISPPSPAGRGLGL